jgi:hypothetical protein
MTNPTPEQIERICVLCAEYVAEDIRTRVWRLAAQGLAKQRDELQSRLDAAEKALAQARAEGSEGGIRGVTLIRCVAHRNVPAYNHNEATGAECAACAVEPLIGSQCLQSERLMNKDLRAQLAQVTKERDEARKISEERFALLQKWESFRDTIETLAGLSRLEGK